jgi:uncharacterized pyridoxamine 5'-phosphate oxidase family protein
MKMDFLQEFNRIMEETNKIALATSVDNIPNVRVINFCDKPENKGVIYFSSFRGLPKTLEFSKNNIVAFTTIPTSSESSQHLRVQNAKVIKSDLTIFDLKEEFIKKHPDYEMIIAQAGEMLDVYELHFKVAAVILDLGKGGKVTF